MLCCILLYFHAFCIDYTFHNAAHLEYLYFILTLILLNFNVYYHGYRQMGGGGENHSMQRLRAFDI